MARKFVTEAELALISNITKELIQNWIGEEVVYYAISQQETAPHPLYEESVSKVTADPVRVNALVRYDNPTEESTQMGSDARYDLEVYFHQSELDDRNLRPRQGDFVEYGGIFFEIASVTLPQLVFGQVNNKVMTKCVCVPAREGQFSAGGSTDTGLDNTHPIENSKRFKP